MGEASNANPVAKTGHCGSKIIDLSIVKICIRVQNGIANMNASLRGREVSFETYASTSDERDRSTAPPKNNNCSGAW